MSLAHLLPLLDDVGDFRRLESALADGERRTVADLPAAARPFILAALAARGRRPLLVVVARQDHAVELAAQVARYAPAGLPVDAWPTPDAIPYERLPRDQPRAAGRLALLVRLLDRDAAAGPAVLVTPARALMQQLAAPAALRAATVTLRVGDAVPMRDLLTRWTALGFEAASQVEQPGTLAWRGGIIDIWPATTDQPVRIELWGDTIDSLRLFDPASQRSGGRLERVIVPPPVEVPIWEAAAALPALSAEAELAGLRPEAADEWRAAVDRLAVGFVTAEVDLLAPYLARPPAALLDFLPPETLIVIDEPDSVAIAGRQVEAQAEELRAQFEGQGELPAGLRRPYHPWAAVAARLGELAMLRFGSAPADEEDRTVVLAGFRPAPAFAGQTDRMVAAVSERVRGRRRTVLVSDQSQRLTEVLAEHDIFAVGSGGAEEQRGEGPEGRGSGAAPTGAVSSAPPLPRSSAPPLLRSSAPPAPGTVEVIHGGLSAGWVGEELDTLVLSDLELFGWQPKRRPIGRRAPAAARAFLDRLKPGDYVVHIEHGIALYQGLVTREAAGVEREFMLLQYAGADRLYVPVDQTDRVLPYAAAGVAPPALNRLGSPDWERTKRRVRRAVADMAQELLAIYSARQVVAGHPYAPDGQWQVELEEAFPYEETPDQMAAIVDVKADMESERPMDRLICGDVGYGKTEVALRAAFKAVADGRQVAVLVPTTVLALQHFDTFNGRLQMFPVEIEMLSRLRTPRHQDDIVERLASGRLDIVIGTHRLLQADVKFKNLGLLIVDEEQRFGVRHKERLKQLRMEVDVLTLSATPIPRTLHMSLIGVRDMSLIETPPEERLPIRTFVRPASDDLVREVILRELDRGGQIYYVHNRVQSIPHVAHRLRQLVPEARLLIGHGQMEERDLERVMLAFVRHEADLLLCTTIIESGLDIPNVNTLVVEDADHFGLAQLYQLRGRVGRSSTRAYAYLLYEPRRPMTPEGQARLEAIQEATELGAGFRIALKDLEIRGAGNLLGAEQHGHLEAVGFDLYTRMLAQAVEVARGQPPPKELPPISLDLPFDAHLPASYVADPDVRLSLYQRLAQPADPGPIADLERELVDRFGPLPPAAANLLDVLRIKSRAIALGIESIGTIEGELVLRPVPTGRLDAAAVRRIGSGAVRTTPSTVRLDLGRLGEGWRAALFAVLELIEAAARTVPALAG